MARRQLQRGFPRGGKWENRERGADALRPQLRSLGLAENEKKKPTK